MTGYVETIADIAGIPFVVRADYDVEIDDINGFGNPWDLSWHVVCLDNLRLRENLKKVVAIYVVPRDFSSRKQYVRKFNRTVHQIKSALKFHEASKYIDETTVIEQAQKDSKEYQGD